MSGTLHLTQSSSDSSNALTVQEAGTGFAIDVGGGTNGGGGVYAAAGDPALVSIEGFSNGNTIGVWGKSTAGGDGVYGSSASGNGVGATSASGIGVNAASQGNHGVSGFTSAYAYAGVYGTNANTSGGWGVRGDAIDSGSGVYGNNTNSAGWGGDFNGNVNIVQSLYFNGICYHGPCTSDVRLKKNIQPLSGSLEVIAKLRPVTYEWKEPTDHRPAGTHTGFIAQEVEKVKPEWVGTDDQGFKNLNTNDLPVLLVDSVRTLKMENDELRDRVRALESGRRPMISGFGEGGIGLGLLAVAGAVLVSPRRRSATTG